MKPATAAVLRLLRARGSEGVTPAEARSAVHTDRLGARIWELKRDGYAIRREWVTVEGARFARYVLDEPVVLRADAGTQVGAGL